MISFVKVRWFRNNYLSTVLSRCVSEIWWFSSRGKEAGICSAPPCQSSLQPGGQAAAAGPDGDGAEARFGPPACVESKTGRSQKGWCVPKLPWPEVCRPSEPACPCRGTAADCGCSPPPGISDRHRSL